MVLFKWSSCRSLLVSRCTRRFRSFPGRPYSQLVQSLVKEEKIDLVSIIHMRDLKQKLLNCAHQLSILPPSGELHCLYTAMHQLLLDLEPKLGGIQAGLDSLLEVNTLQSAIHVLESNTNGSLDQLSTDQLRTLISESSSAHSLLHQNVTVAVMPTLVHLGSQDMDIKPTLPVVSQCDAINILQSLSTDLSTASFVTSEMAEV